MKKRTFESILLLIFVVMPLVYYYSNKYVKEDRILNDIQRRLNNKDFKISNFEMLSQKDEENGRILLYRYTMNNINMIGCAVYENNTF